MGLRLQCSDALELDVARRISQGMEAVLCITVQNPNSGKGKILPPKMGAEHSCRARACLPTRPLMFVAAFPVEPFWRVKKEDLSFSELTAMIPMAAFPCTSDHLHSG
jgi:uncharacterized membrane protein